MCAGRRNAPMVSDTTCGTTLSVTTQNPTGQFVTPANANDAPASSTASSTVVASATSGRAVRFSTAADGPMNSENGRADYFPLLAPTADLVVNVVFFVESLVFAVQPALTDA